MAYFNYFVKCIIRRFVKLFFTRKTFIFLLILALVFVFSCKNFVYGFSEQALAPCYMNLYSDYSFSHVSTNIVSSPNLVVNELKSFKIYQLFSGETYTLYNPTQYITGYMLYDLSFANLFSPSSSLSSNGSTIESGTSSFSGTSTSSTIGGSGGVTSGSSSGNGSFSSTGTTSSTTSVPSTFDYVVYNISAVTYVSGVSFNQGVDCFVLFPTDNFPSLSVVRLAKEVTSDDVQSQTGVISSSASETQNTIKDSSQQMQNTITDSDVNVSTDLPTDDTQDITESGFDSIFTTLRNAFTNSSSQDLVLEIPFTGKSFTINFANVYGGFDSGIVGTLIKLFWWYCVSVFIVKDISVKISKIKSGNIEGIENTNIKEDLL